MAAFTDKCSGRPKRVKYREEGVGLILIREHDRYHGLAVVAGTCDRDELNGNG